MRIGRSIRAALAVSALAVIVGTMPAMAAPKPSASFALKGTLKNSVQTSPARLAGLGTGAFRDETVGSGTRKVWFTSDSGNGGLWLKKIPASGRKTYTIELRVRSACVMSCGFNKLVGFGAGDDNAGSNFSPGTSTFPDSGLYFWNGQILLYSVEADNTILYTWDNTGLADDTWMTIRLTRKETASGPDAFTVFINGNCAGTVNDAGGVAVLLNGNAVFGVDDTDEVQPTSFAGIKVWKSALLPEPCVD